MLEKTKTKMKNMMLNLFVNSNICRRLVSQILRHFVNNVNIMKNYSSSNIQAMLLLYFKPDT